MDNIGSGEVLVILMVALMVLGPEKLPHAIRQVGNFFSEMRRIAMGFKKEFSDALEEPLKQSQMTLKAADPRNMFTTARTNYMKATSDGSTMDTGMVEKSTAKASTSNDAKTTSDSSTMDTGMIEKSTAKASTSINTINPK